MRGSKTRRAKNKQEESHKLKTREMNQLLMTSRNRFVKTTQLGWVMAIS